MRVWAPAKIDEIRKKRGMSTLGLVTAMIKVQDAYGIATSNNHVRNIINGEVNNPGVNYVNLFADVLGCTPDDFNTIKQKKA